MGQMGAEREREEGEGRGDRDSERAQLWGVVTVWWAESHKPGERMVKQSHGDFATEPPAC